MELTHFGNIYSFYYRKPRKFKFIRVVSLFLVVIFCILLIFLAINKKSEKLNLKENHFISIFTTKNKTTAKEYSDIVKNEGGAGYLYFDGEFYNVLAFAFLNLNEANDNLQKIKTKYASAEIVSIKLPSIKRKIKNIITNNHILNMSFMELKDTLNILCSLTMANTSLIYRNINKVLLMLEKGYEKLNSLKDSKVCDEFKILYKTILSLVNLSLEGLYLNEAPYSIINNLYINTFFQYQNFIRTLNNL